MCFKCVFVPIMDIYFTVHLGKHAGSVGACLCTYVCLIREAMQEKIQTVCV